MTATNHALTGALIGFISSNPYIAIPAAVLSHFVCDAIPHFGPGRDDTASQEWFKYFLIIDASLCVGLVITMTVIKPEHWLLASFSAFAATSPDLMWIKKFIRARRGQPEPPRLPWLLRFHAAIQWFERPPGVIVEAAWASAAVLLLEFYIR